MYLTAQVIISRNYRGDVDPSVIDKFITLYSDKEEDCSLTPLLESHDATFIYVRYSNLFCTLLALALVIRTIISVPALKDSVTGFGWPKLRQPDNRARMASFSQIT